MSHHPPENLIEKNLRIVEERLVRNGDWLQLSDNVIHSFEKNNNQWDETFYKVMLEVEEILKDLEKMFKEI